MRRITGYGALSALLLATLYAPLFHLHTNAGEAPLLHAHFPTAEVSDDDSVVHMEPPHSHAGARSIDVLITTPAHPAPADAVLLTTYSASRWALPCCGFVSIDAPRAHAPPGCRSLIPRAPPA